MFTHYPIIQNITPMVQNYVTGIVRQVMVGGGLAYAVQNDFWHHIPLIFLSPFAYASYQVYVSQPQVIAWGKKTLKEIR